MINKRKWCAVLAWFFPIGLLWYFLDDDLKKDKFVSYHVKQSATLFLLLIGVAVLAALLLMIRNFVIVIGLLVVFILFLVGLFNAFSGKKKPLPIIGFIGEKLDL